MTTAHQPDHRHEVDLDTALEFINTLDLDDGLLVEHFGEPSDAASWFADHGLIHPSDGRRWDSPDLDRIREVRAALRQVVEAVVDEAVPPEAAVRRVNAALQMPRSPRLELAGREVRLGHRHAGPAVDEALATLASTIVGELAAGRPERFRVCANDRCRWTFFDSSPTGRRRWCDMQTCGNRAKAARHRARVKAESATSATA